MPRNLQIKQHFVKLEALERRVFSFLSQKGLDLLHHLGVWNVRREEL